jgi:ABC-type transport system involved in multi-copper enzyme maturation permease subunit
MSQFIDLTRYEFNMSIRRPGFWVAYILVSLFYLISIMSTLIDGSHGIIPADQIWAEAVHTVFMFNIFMPLLAGILAADRMQRDFQLRVAELHRSSPLTNPIYILAKYLGVLVSVLIPIFLISLISGLLLIGQGLVDLQILWPLLLAFLAIAVPAHAFVVAFSLACPLIIPLRIYQVLFTGYWFWGNLISPKVFPTISDTVLNAVGQYPLQAYFDVLTDSTAPVSEAFTPPEAILNLIVLMACITCALFASHYYLRWQYKRN